MIKIFYKKSHLALTNAKRDDKIIANRVNIRRCDSDEVADR